MKRIIYTNKAPEPIGPYSQAILVNDTLYISGQIPFKDGEWINVSIDAETRQVMENIGAILSEAGMDYSNIVKCSIYITNMDNFPIINEIYSSYFSKNPPARETIEVSGLPKGVNVEISAVSVL